MSVEINKEIFGKRIKKFYEVWKVSFLSFICPCAQVLRTCSALLGCMTLQDKQADVWDDANVLAVVVGGTSEDLRYLKSISLQLWLFGYELPGQHWVYQSAAHALHAEALS